MNLKDYLNTVEKTYKFRVKSVFAIDDEQMDIIERVLHKYRPNEIGRPKKMMFQTTPLGFTGLKNVEVHYIDVVLTVPAVADILENDLREQLGLKSDHEGLVVMAENDPRMVVDAEPKKVESKLLDPEYKDAEEVKADEVSGDKYNKGLLKYFQKVADEREHNPGRVEVDAKAEPKIVADDFNANLSGEAVALPKKAK